MTALDVFEHGNWSVRTVVLDDEPWFVAADVCAALGYTNGRKAVADHVDDLDKGVTASDTPGGRQNVTIVNESGLYALIFGSRLEAAQTFKRWVTSEVLPALRRAGTYTVSAAPPPSTEIRVPTTMVEALELALDQARQIETLHEQIGELAPDADDWRTLAVADGDFTVRDAALILQNDHGINIGATRLFRKLRELGWIGSDNRPLQPHGPNGTRRVTERPSSYTDPDTGRTFLAFQPRVTVKGLSDLRRELARPALQVVNGGPR